MAAAIQHLFDLPYESGGDTGRGQSGVPLSAGRWREAGFDMLAEWEEKWLLEEYKLLSAHYFHEDQTYFRMGGLLITLNSALVAFSAASDKVSRLPLVALALFSVFGLVLTLTWMFMLLRIRALRLASTERITEIETALEAHWSATVPSPRIRLGLQQRMAGLPGRFPSRWARRIPATMLFLLVPVVVAAYWISLPFWR